MTSLKTSIKTITYLSDIGCLEIQGASLGGTITDIYDTATKITDIDTHSIER
ncbi:DNA methylase [Escherichia coli]|nr:DNA methylase [Escherichia coli]